MKIDAIKGSVPRTVFRFSLPFFLSYFLQTLYGLVDLYLIGQFQGAAGTTAVAVGSQVMHMVTVIIVGLSMGVTVTVGRSVGAGEEKRAAAYTGSAVTLFALLSLVAAAILFFCAGGVVSVVSTPAEAVVGTRDYLRICFLGIPFIALYNVISAALRGEGDSKTPLLFVAVSCVVNVILDLAFLGIFHMGPEGAALGTVLAQGFSVVFAVVILLQRKSILFPQKKDFALRWGTLWELLCIGFPVAVQDGLVQVAFLVITAIANGRGLTDAAAVGVVEKVIGILFLIPSSMLSTVSALSAQNLGAGEEKRARQVLYCALATAVAWGLFMVVVMQFAAESAVSLFSRESDVIVAGGRYLRGYVWDCVLAGIHFCFSGYFCACGKAWLSFLHNLLSISVARIPLAYLASLYFPDTLFPMGIATSAGSGLSVVICVIAYFLLIRKKFC